MSRHRRISPDNSIHHVLNRGNRRATIFHKPTDYDAFVNLLCDTLDHVAMRILAVCLMPNHFHLVLWPEKGSELSAYMRWLMNAHVRRYHEHYGTTGLGHIYQGRFKNFLVQSNEHLCNVLRYVEGNPVRAGLVSDARLWKWSSVGHRFTPDGREYLTEWPISRPTDWPDRVNGLLSCEDLRRIQHSVTKGTPYGESGWVTRMVKLHSLESTIRPRGRRRIIQPASAFGFE
jgi:REP-associated tyrosine transposase